MISNAPTRRSTLKAIGSLGIVAALAGCSGDSNGGAAYEYPDASTVATEPDYGDWFDGVDNYDGTLDLTDRDSITIGVGTEGGFAYTPAAVLVDAGTEVVWEWTGEGGFHDVAEESGAFNSEETDEAGFEFTQQLDESGQYLYVCTPHEAMGMKGAVVVE